MEKTQSALEEAYAMESRIRSKVLERFESNSPVFLSTNECLYAYEHHFENKKNMLSVIGSSDQILSAISKGVEEIEAFDIRKFAKYAFYLKSAAFLGLSRDEYMSFFYGLINSNMHPVKDRVARVYYFDKIRRHLNEKGRIFWDHLFSNFSWGVIYFNFFDLGWAKNAIYNFSKKNMNYLEPKTYLEMRSRLKDLQIEFKTGDITDLAPTYNKEYDLIYLSNIISYVGYSDFGRLLKRLKTTPDGIMLLGLVYNTRGFKIAGDFNFDEYADTPYTFTREPWYITGRRKN